METPLLLEDPHVVFDYFWHELKANDERAVAVARCSVDEQGVTLKMDEIDAPLGALFHLAINDQNEAIMTSRGPVIVLEHYKDVGRYNTPGQYNYSLEGFSAIQEAVEDPKNLTGLDIAKLIPPTVEKSVQ